MTVTNFFILTTAEKEAAEAFDNADVALGPRVVDGSSPGVGLNLNDNAADYEPGDPVTLTGKWVASKRIVDDPDYLTYAADMVAYLLDKPFATLEPETIFAPAPLAAP
jgi:hypothetical protein